MVNDNEQYARLWITGHFDPSTITARLGIEPTKSGVVRKKRLQEEHHFSNWLLDTRLAHSEPLENHVKDILDQVQTQAAEIKSIAKEFNCWIQLVGHQKDDYFAISLDKDLILSLAELNAGLDFDIYCNGYQDEEVPESANSSQ